MGRYLLRNTTRPAERYLDEELRLRLAARALSLSMAMLVRDLFDDRAAPARLPDQNLSLAYADELQALRLARRLTSTGDAKAFWSMASRRSAIYESHCQIGN